MLGSFWMMLVCGVLGQPLLESVSGSPGKSLRAGPSDKWSWELREHPPSPEIAARVSDVARPCRAQCARRRQELKVRGKGGRPVARGR
jgi:hypothetical protein